MQKERKKNRNLFKLSGILFAICHYDCHIVSINTNSYTVSLNTVEKFPTGDK